jgi:chromosome transmission fidelity protein 18
LQKEKFHQGLATIVDDENVIAGLGVERDKNSEEIDSLWVDKYKPKSYMDLLSDEATNKSLLHWLKLWDKSVFGNDYLSKVKITKEKYSKLGNLHIQLF